MKAIIVAAGKGTRINGTDEPKPKPLFKCHGKYLIEYVIENLHKAGIDHIYIIVGFMKEKIMESLGNGSKYHLTITYIENDEYEKANGLSVYKAKPYINEPFILSMSDHIFETAAVKQFVSAMSKELPLLKNYLYTDKKLHQISDLDDATKVLEENNQIKRIHKKLTDYNSIDTGMFCLTPDFFTALEQAQATGDYSITGGIQTLANANKMNTLNIGPYLWMDIDTKQELEILEHKFEKFNFE